MVHKNNLTMMLSRMMMMLWLVLSPLAAGSVQWFKGGQGDKAGRAAGQRGIAERFHTVDVKDGLADNFVRDIMVDSEGFVWFSTINGVSRYDGYRFRNYMPQQWGGRSGDVMMVRETSDGTLWMLCSGELFTYHRDTRSWRKDGMERLGRLGIEGSRVSKFYVDEGGDLWVCTDRGLWTYGSRLRHIDGSGLSPVLHIVSKNGTTLIVTADYNIYKVGGDNAQLTLLTRHPKPDAEGRDCRVLLDSRMNLWINHAHGQAGTQWFYSLASGQWQQATWLRQIGADATVNVMAEDNDGNLWVGTGNRGIHVVGAGMASVSAFKPMSSHITCFFADKNNTMWVGSAKLGAAYADLGYPDFNLVGTGGREDVSALMADAEGRLWIGFDGAGIIMRDKSGATSEYVVQKGLLPSDIITSLAADATGGVLAGTYGNGIARFDGRRFVPLYPDFDCLRYVKAMATDRHGSLWVATVDKGVVRITADGRVSNYTTANSQLPSNGTLCLSYDAGRDRVYVGTSLGVAAFDYGRVDFISVAGFEQMAGTYVTSLLMYGTGDLWIGSRDGLWVCNPDTGNVTHLTTEQGLSHNVVRALAQGSDGIWVSTDNGLTHCSVTYKPYTIRLMPFFGTDGLHDIIFSNNAALTTSDGTVLLGCYTGYISIPSVERPLVPFVGKGLQVHFTDFRINGNEAEGSLEDFTIRYGERPTIFVSAMMPALSRKIHYYYRFKGDEEWVRSPGNSLYFVALNPGRHVLQVKAEVPGLNATGTEDAAGHDTSPIAELSITVTAPLWLTTPAILFYVLLFVVLVWLVYRAIRRRQKREVAMKQMEINLKKYEMEEDKIRFFTNISHDLKTPLTLVVAPLEKIRESNLPEAVRTELDVVWRNARQLYDLVLELLDFRRLDVGKEKLNLSHGDLVNFVRQTAQSFAYYITLKQITLRLELPQTPIETLFDENKMRRIITNLLSNAYKYNVDGGSVTVTLAHKEEVIELSVADTGIGVRDKKHIFDRFMQETHGQEQEGSGLGLHIVHQYVDMMGGHIDVDDNHPRGTVFTVTLPVHREDAAGSHDDLPAAENVTNAAPDSRLPAPSVQRSTQSTLLIVEDNNDARQFLQRSMEDEYQVLLVANGKEAFDLLYKNDGVNLIVSDVMMPVMDGIEFVRRLRKDIRYSHIPVILLTAKSSEDDIIAGLEEGVADYLTKPFSMAVLRLRIRKILEWSQQVHEKVATGIEIKPSEMTVSSIDEELISRVIADIEANIQDVGYSVVQLSSSVGMTRGHLYKKLMAIVGKSPVEFIRIVRLKRGKSLLDQGRTNISEVADRVGLSPKMFGRYFKDMYGTTPTDYLKHLKS